jgi:long-subunit fatty acid transport protein
MSVGGVQSFTVGRALMAEVGIRYMLADKWALPFSFGAGLLNLSPNGGGDASTDLGLSFTVGFQRYFRTWRRIAPYFGAKLSMSYVDPSGEKNYFVRIGIGPALGIEYFIADRVSLSMEYNVFLSFQIEGDNASRAAGALGGTVVAFNTSLWMGGQMALTFYF